MKKAFSIIDNATVLLILLILPVFFILEIRADVELLEPEATLATVDPNLLWITDLGPTTYADIAFGESGSYVLMNWNDGKLDITYDANNCTASAKTFFDCMIPYFQDQIDEYVEDKIKEQVRKQNRAYEYIDIQIGCKCGNQPFVEIPFHTNNFWPVEFTCAVCKTKYTISRDLK